MKARPAVVAFVAAFLLPALPLAGAAPPAAPRPLSACEHAGVRIAAAFLEEGPEAIWRSLSAGSPLRKLPRDQAIAEIEVRTGPRDGATWELLSVVPSLADRAAAFSINYPSGIDDTLFMTFSREGGDYRIDNLTITVDPVNSPTLQPGKRTRGDRRDAGPVTAPLVLGLLGFAIGGAAAFGRGSFPTGAIRLMVLGGVMAAAGLVWTEAPRLVRLVRTPREDAGKPPSAESPYLGRLVPLRRALASGNADAARAAIPGSVTSRESDAILLWQAQADLQQMRAAEVESTLKYFPRPTNIPLAEILRGRLAFFQSREVDTVLAYERAVNLGPGRDALWYEAAQAFSILGFEERARSYLQRLAHIGSRKADVYYALAVQAADKDKTDEAERLVKLGWELKPADRRELIDVPELWEVMRKPSVAKLVSLSAAEEPRVASASLGTRPAQFPAGTEVRALGDFLDLRIDDQELVVPGGACMASPGTEATDVGTWTLAEEQKAVDDFPVLIRFTRSPGVMAQPLLRSRMQKTAAALLKWNRWDDLLALTANLSPSADNVPTRLLFLRGAALMKKQDLAAVKRLALDLAVSPTVRRKADPQEMWEIGEMLASAGSYPEAIRMMEKASSIREIPFVDDRVRQLSMNQRLASSYETEKTEHFEIHYPNDVGRLFATGIADVLEQEYKRLTKWIPLTRFQPVVVNVVWWQEFRSTYTGSDFILGFYDGKITLPFAGVSGYPPEVIAILSHELAHAMIAQSTGDQAPRWFQEGLAQRIEMVQYAPNALNMYEDDKLLSLSLLDAVMQGSPDPDMITEAYIEAQTIIRYIEAEYGTEGINHMLSSYRGGARTEEAIARLTGKTVAAFDNDMRAWGRSGTAKVFVNPDPIRYDEPLEDVLKVNEGGR